MVFSRSKLPDFDDIMHQFYHAVRASEGEESNMQQGNLQIPSYLYVNAL